jgi:hypothetical protein
VGKVALVSALLDRQVQVQIPLFSGQVQTQVITQMQILGVEVHHSRQFGRKAMDSDIERVEMSRQGDNVPISSMLVIQGHSIGTLNMSLTFLKMLPRICP